MCTIITLFRVHPAFPLVIAANRDERYDRPSGGPTVLDGAVAAVAGRDLVCGGTWFGINRHGMAVAVADQGLAPPAAPAEAEAARTRAASETARLDAAPGGATAEQPRRSRGLLVLDALRCASIVDVGRLLHRSLDQAYNPFSLLHADTEEAWIGHHGAVPLSPVPPDAGLPVGEQQRRVLLSRSQVAREGNEAAREASALGSRLQSLAPGLHVLVSGIGSENAPRRVSRVRELLDVHRLARLDATSLVDTLAGALRYHAAPGEPDDAVCRHGQETGTVSSLVALVRSRLGASQLHCALGPPCRTAYADYSSLLAQLG